MSHRCPSNCNDYLSNLIVEKNVLLIIVMGCLQRCIRFRFLLIFFFCFVCTWELYKKSRLVCWPSVAKDEVTTCLLTAYNSTVSSLLDKHAPIITKISNRKSKSNPWFSHPLRAFRTTLHHAESVYKRTHSALDWSTFKSLRNRYHHLILDSKKKQYFSKLVSSSSDNPRRLWQTQ